MNLGVKQFGLAGVISSYAKPLATLEAATQRIVTHHGQILTTRVKAKASGRPGPNAPTGDYRRDISMQVRREGPLRWTAEVGTNKPQGRRLEFGFHGTDSLGRFYNQPPYPHFGPAFDEVVPGFEAAIATLLVIS